MLFGGDAWSNPPKSLISLLTSSKIATHTGATMKAKLVVGITTSLPKAMGLHGGCIGLVVTVEMLDRLRIVCILACVLLCSIIWKLAWPAIQFTLMGLFGFWSLSHCKKSERWLRCQYEERCSFSWLGRVVPAACRDARVGFSFRNQYQEAKDRSC